MNKGLFIFLTIAIGLSLPIHAQDLDPATLPVRDSDFACIAKAQADQFVRDFRINVSSFGGLELCDSKVDTKKLFNDLLLIKEGRFLTFGGNPLIKGFLAADQYYSWMKTQTRGIDRGQDVPFATAYNSGGYFTMQDGWATLSTLGRVGTVVHEARHTAGYTHIACNQGPYINTGVSGCDRDYNYGGSHGIEMEYYARVSVLGSNFHPVYKKMARLMAMGRSNFVFNTSPLRQKEVLMALGRSGQVYVQTGSEQNPWALRETPGGLSGFALKRSSFGAVLFNGLSTIAIDPYQNSGFDWSVKDDYSYYKLIGEGQRNAGLTLDDFEEFDLGRKRYVVALDAKKGLSKFVFREGSFSRPSQLPAGSLRFATTSPSGQVGLFLVDQTNGAFLSVDPERMSVSKTSEALPQGVAKYTKTPQGLFELRQSGDLMWIQNGQAKTLITPEPLLDVVSVPLYDSFEVVF